MKRFFQGRRKTTAAKVLMGVMAFFFLLQTQPLFCACMTDGTPVGVSASASLPMQGGMPMKDCPCKDDDSAPQKANHSPCPLCHGLNTSSPEKQDNTFVVSPGNSFTGLILPATSLFAGPSLAMIRLIPNGEPLHEERPDRPIHLLNNSFRF